MMRPSGALGARAVSRYLEKALGLVPVEPPQRLPGTAENAVWRVTARTGVHVAKIYPAGCRAVVELEVDLCDYLRDRAVRTPDPLAAGGERIGTIGGGWRALLGTHARPILVMAWNHGREPHAASVGRAELVSIARHIGLMHEALRHYPRRAEVRPTERWGEHLGRFDDFLRSPNARTCTAQELVRLRALDQRMQQRARAAAGAAASTRAVLHGDLGLRHVRLERPGDAPFLFDFADFSRGPVVLDLATLLSQLYCRADIDIGRWEQLRAWMLEGYLSAFPLSRDDRRALEDALVERLLIEARYFNRVALARGQPFEPASVRKCYRLAAHLIGDEPARHRRAPGAPGNRAPRGAEPGPARGGGRDGAEKRKKRSA